MVEEKYLSEHLRKVSQESWNELFCLIPIINETKSFSQIKGGEKLDDGVKRAHYVSDNEVVSKFFRQWRRMNLLVTFNWPEWQEGREAARDPAFDYSAVSASFLCKLVSAIIRNDRFSEGALASAFENGMIQKILHALQQKVEKSQLD